MNICCLSHRYQGVNFKKTMKKNPQAKTEKNTCNK